MKEYIKGSFRKSIYKSPAGYTIGLFKIRETNDPKFEEFVNKTVTFTGFFHDLNTDDTYMFYGKVVEHERYGFQYEVKEYERVKPEGKDGLVEFLSSEIFSGIGEKMAIKMVESLGEDTLKKIKEDYECLLNIRGMTARKAKNVYDVLIKYEESEDIIIYLCDLGFSTREALLIYKTYGSDALYNVEDNIYNLVDDIGGLTFSRVDEFRNKLNINDDDKRRVKGCMLFSINDICFKNGDTYVTLEEIALYISYLFNITIERETFEYYMAELNKENKIIIKEDKYYLKSYYEAELNIGKMLTKFNNMESFVKGDLSNFITKLEKDNNIIYNKEQKEAIIKALENNMLIITGGPGTGKTTIIKAIVNIYQEINNLNYADLSEEVALIAPTGRASKRMSESTLLPSFTIHRFLKWNKENDSFGINESNKAKCKFVIIDEVSMIDTLLLSNLIKGLNNDVKLLMVGDYNQLPSVGPGQVLKDLIESNEINIVSLEMLYRQGSESYIPILANEIKDNNLSDSFNENKDDFSFIETSNEMVKSNIVKICEKAIAKGYNEKDIQILCPMYKGENGIDHLNLALQDVFNPKGIDKKEFKSGNITYREGDKILQLVNMPDENISNGDIGIIKHIKQSHESSSKKIEIHIDFDGNGVKYYIKDLMNITHAYAISIHKAQGSEFKIVIMPIVNSFKRMLYKKLIYTGITRAKTSLILIGNKEVFKYGISVNEDKPRKTSLMEMIQNK